VQWLRSGGDVASLRAGIGELARKKGITDWEQDQKTLEGVGRGFKQASISGQRYTDLSAAVAGGNLQAAEWIRKGYKAERVD
jgi:hypothetical protein